MKTVIKVKFSDITDNVNYGTPVFTYCRKLIKEGVDPGTRLEVYRDRDEPDIAIRIGEGAKLTVKEDPHIHFAKYRDPTSSLKGTISI